VLSRPRDVEVCIDTLSWPLGLSLAKFMRRTVLEFLAKGRLSGLLICHLIIIVPGGVLPLLFFKAFGDGQLASTTILFVLISFVTAFRLVSRIWHGIAINVVYYADI